MANALVVGASGGIGEAVAIELITRGYITHGTWNTRLSPYAKFKLDVGVESSQYDVENLVRHLPPIDILVVCAGWLQQKPWQQIYYDDWMSVLEVNLMGTFWCIQAFLPVMMERKSGSIVTVASVGGQQGGTLAVHYAAAKAGVISLTKSFARIGAPYVRVNCVSPGLVDTPMTRGEIASVEGQQKIARIPLGRVATPAEIAKVIVDVAESTYMTGAVVNVNGGEYV